VLHNIKISFFLIFKFILMIPSGNPPKYHKEKKVKNNVGCFENGNIHTCKNFIFKNVLRVFQLCKHMYTYITDLGRVFLNKENKHM